MAHIEAELLSPSLPNWACPVIPSPTQLTHQSLPTTVDMATKNELLGRYLDDQRRDCQSAKRQRTSSKGVAAVSSKASVASTPSSGDGGGNNNTGQNLEVEDGLNTTTIYCSLFRFLFLSYFFLVYELWWIFFLIYESFVANKK